MPLEYREIDELGDRVYTVESGTYTTFYTKKAQRIELFTNAQHGRMIFIDGMLQSAERDEEYYHTGLVNGIEKKGRCLVLGGGEGAVLRELLRRDADSGAGITEVTMVDWDEDFVRYMREKEPYWNHGAFDDSRVNLVFDDAWEWCRTRLVGLYSCIIVDLFDPELDKEGENRRWIELYRILSLHLDTDGVLVLNGGRELPYDTGARNHLQKILGEAFPGREITFRTPYIASFGSPWLLGHIGPMQINEDHERAE